MDRRELALGCGLVAPVLALVTIALATALDPGFGWLDSALSDTGAIPSGRSISPSLVADHPSILAFNGGLLLTGLVGLPFAWLLYADAGHALERVGATLFGLALVLLAGVGIFPVPHPLHGPVAIGHFLSVTCFFWSYGAGATLAGRRRFGAATAAFGVGHVLAWAIWIAVLVDGPVPGIALPELVGALLFGGWAFVVASGRLATTDE